ncbi:MAG: LytTR family DNA-binding domain-containing protein [Pseudomonadota bacterium]
MPLEGGPVTGYSVNGGVGSVNGRRPQQPSAYDGRMDARFILLLLLGCGLFEPLSAIDQPFPTTIQICPALPDERTPPVDFDRPQCWTADRFGLDVQHRMLWIRLQFQPQTLDRSFTGLLLSMKAASEVYLSGERVDANGRPGANRQTEQPGRMDTVIALDGSRLAEADYQIDVLTSSFHNVLTLSHPIHGIQLVDYPNQQDRTLRYYLSTLLPLGLFLLAMVYFGTLTWQREQRAVPALLTALAGLATVQLLFEVSRGLVAYAYPFQDLRLMGILACSLGFGGCLVAMLALRYARAHFGWVLALTAIGMLAAIALPTSWDSKTAWVLMNGSFLALAVALMGVRSGQPGAGAYAIMLVVFILTNLITDGQFIDHGFYYLVALFLLGLMILQAVEFARERRLRMDERLRADQLELALDRVQIETAQQTLSVPSTGRVQSVAVKDLVRVQGAGDYVELHLNDGSELLHTATLSELEDELPAYFLRVHRSHLVNTRCIEQLERNDSGTGRLQLHNGQTVPVSRRIMPGVRRALS